VLLRGEGFLAFRACPSCAATVLVCDEVGTVFPDPQAVARGDADLPRHEPRDACARCGGHRFDEFRPATPDEVQALGFGPDSYR
jgi:hypothetical protein